MGIGRLLISLGILLVVAGLLFTFADRLPLRLGRLPGDIHFQGKNTSFYFPVTTCILLSVVFSVVMWIFRR
jgi:formate hydrogenlyase subunit 3/multisubunit Na+/H+ antiporter MnhD subunit